MSPCCPCMCSSEHVGIRQMHSSHSCNRSHRPLIHLAHSGLFVSHGWVPLRCHVMAKARLWQCSAVEIGGLAVDTSSSGVPTSSEQLHLPSAKRACLAGACLTAII